MDVRDHAKLLDLVSRGCIFDRVRTGTLDDLPPRSAGLVAVTAKGTDAKLEQGFGATLRRVGPLQRLLCAELPLVKSDQRTWPDIRRRKPGLDGDAKPPGRRQIIKLQVGIGRAPLEQPAPVRPRPFRSWRVAATHRRARHGAPAATARAAATSRHWPRRCDRAPGARRRGCRARRRPAGVGNGPVEGLQGLGRTAQGQQSFAFCHEQVGLIGPELQRHVVVEKRKPRPSRREIGVPARHIDKSAPLRRSSPQHVGIAIDLGHRRRAMAHEERAVRHSSFQELASPFSPAHSWPGPVRADPTCPGSRHAPRWHRKPSDGLPGISRTAAPMLQDHRYAIGPLPAGRKAPASDPRSGRGRQSAPTTPINLRQACKAACETRATSPSVRA